MLYRHQSTDLATGDDAAEEQEQLPGLFHTVQIDMPLVHADCSGTPRPQFTVPRHLHRACVPLPYRMPGSQQEEELAAKPSAPNRSRGASGSTSKAAEKAIDRAVARLEVCPSSR